MAGSWEGLDGEVALAVEEQNERVLETYKADPARVGQDANIERSISEGAYAKRQLFELLQNAADATRGTSGRCEVVLTDHTLYVANNGEPVTVKGVNALMATHDSVKRDEQIGRFGLGFKSVLAVSDSPKVISRSGSFVFDREASRTALGRLVPGLAHYPVMRWARAVDPGDERREDAVLDSLMRWATTVVVVPVHRHRDVLADSLAKFPAQFLLFSQHVERLDLEDRSETGAARSITLGRDDEGVLVLNDASRRSRWVVRSQQHSPSHEALVDGGYHAARESVTVTWAAPLAGAPKGVGTFWAYFPTTSGTTLSGIVNAPWKLADDRESLLAGAFNAELLTQVLPHLVADALPSIHSPERPTAVLDVLPARGKEARNYADDVINEPVMRAVSERQCIPTIAGGLRHPKRVRLHPEDMEPAELEIWASACPDPEAWTSHAVTRNEHRAKVVRLMRYHDRPAVSLKKWVEHLVNEPTVEGSAAAVRLVASLVGRMPEHRAELLKARVLLLEDGSVDACRRGQVFLPGPTPQPGRLIIDPIVASDPKVIRALAELGIEVFDNAGELRSELAADEVQWDRVWASSRKNSVEESERIFRDVMGDRLLEDLRVRTYSGAWKSPSGALLAGAVIPGDGSRDGDHLVDPRFHIQDIPLLERLGLVDAPRALLKAPMEPWRQAKLDDARDQYRRSLNSPKMSSQSIHVDEGRIFWPLGLLSRLSPEGRTAMTELLVHRLDGGEKWYVERAAGGNRRSIQSGVWSHLSKHGRLSTAIGSQPVSRCLRWDADVAEMDGVEQPLPFVSATITDDQADALFLKSEVSALRAEDWAEMLDEARGWPDDRRFLLYAWASHLEVPAPPRIRVRRGPGFVDVPAVEAAVTAREEVFDSLVTAGIPALLAPSHPDFECLRDGWSMPVGEDMLTETVDFEEAGESFVLIDRFPPLRSMHRDEVTGVQVQPCDRIELLTATPTGQQSRPLSEHRDGDVVYTTAQTEKELLLQVARALDITVKSDVVVRRMEEQRRNKLRQEVAAATDVLDKLLLAIGVEDLRSSVPEAALAGLGVDGAQGPDDKDIARLALAVDGYGILQVHRSQLEKAGLEPPSVWAGTRKAREWVRGLGLPVEFAGFAGDARSAELEVEGPPILGRLHDYQSAVAAHVKGLLSEESETRRGLVTLPTGAGKTRVAVQALVEHMSSSETPVRFVWVAETDELCEQATQTWSQVWRAQGRAGRPLTVSRLWGDNEPEERDGHQVVVASLDKLASIVQRNDGDWQAEYGWLMHPAMIVVDEAHRSITPQYTKALSALGGTKRVAELQTPLLGLTATPFRGFNDKATRDLLGRYHNNVLLAGVFPGDDPYPYLQDLGVLARVRHKELEGADLVLTPDEVQKLEAMPGKMPDTVESRLGRDAVRNQAIIDAMLELPEEDCALLFATSVENARVLAALLTYNGIEARAVSGKTDPRARRRYVEDFKERRVRVLTNYNVFTEGFDVPKVDAVFITRPTFSPNIYQQMIGRGLRGPLNGGKEEVLIVNVADNLTNFGETFAFHHFDHLWKGRQAGE